MAQPDVSRLKLSTYMPDEPKLWFGIVEAKMGLAGLSFETKEHQSSMFALVVGELPQEVALTVKNLIEDPSTDTAYSDLKKLILSKHQESPTDAHRWMLSATLGDMKA